MCRQLIIVYNFAKREMIFRDKKSVFLALLSEKDMIFWSHRGYLYFLMSSQWYRFTYIQLTKEGNPGQGR